MLLLLTIVGGGVFLASWNIPAPAGKIQKQIPDDKMPR
jgi:hypothetical protein